jgi:hypothetical protein
VKLSHTLASTSAVFDDPNLVSAGGLVPVLALADRAGLGGLAEKHLTVPTDKGANAGLKVASLVGGMVAGADSIDDMALLRHGGMGRIFNNAYAPSTLGSYLRAFTLRPRPPTRCGRLPVPHCGRRMTRRAFDMAAPWRNLRAVHPADLFANDPEVRGRRHASWRD